MARYHDEDHSGAPAAMGGRIAELLALGFHSVEVLRNGDAVILRMWLDPHCDPTQQQQV